MQEVFKHHELLDEIISDRVLEIVRVSHKLSLSYHPQINDQIEGTNQTLEQCHRCCMNYQQDDWMDFFHMVEFLTIIIKFTRYTSLFANTRCHPH